jgi:phosphoribosyl-ATP pyrophosphohydrolase
MTMTDATVLDRLWETIESRRGADPALSHSARLLSRGTAKVAQKFGEEAVECVIEAVRGEDRAALIGESADVLYHPCAVGGCWGAARGGLGRTRPPRGRERDRREGGAASVNPPGHAPGSGISPYFSITLFIWAGSGAPAATSAAISRK